MLDSIIRSSLAVAWIIFLSIVVVGILGITINAWWWMGIAFAVGGYLLATIDSTWTMIKEGTIPRLVS